MQLPAGPIEIPGVETTHTVRHRGMGTGISEASKREILFFPLLPREASNRVPVFDGGTGSTPERLRSGSLQGDLSLIV